MLFQTRFSSRDLCTTKTLWLAFYSNLSKNGKDTYHQRYSQTTKN